MTDDRQGLTKMSDHAPAAGSRLYLWIHISRLAQRLLLQQAQARGMMILDSSDMLAIERGWTEVPRTFAEGIARHRCKQAEPEEFAKLGRIGSAAPDARAARATFLSRWFPVPRPGEVGVISWDADELREIGRWMAPEVRPESNAWPEKPPGWQESLRVLDGRKRKKGAA